MRHHKILLVTLTCGALITTACGGDDGATAEDPSTTAATVTASDDTVATDDGTEAGVDGANPIAMMAESLAGTYVGEWTNTTFGSTGSIDITVEIDVEAAVATLTVDLGGMVFGLSDPEVETIEVPLVGLQGTPIQTVLFGPVVTSANATLTAFSGLAAAVPADSIETFEFEAAVAEDGLTGTYKVTFPDLTDAQGTFSITPA